MSVTRIYVEKKEPYAVEAAGVLASLKNDLNLGGKLRRVRLLNRYDVEGISREVFDSVRDTVFSEPQVDLVYEELPAFDGVVFAIEYLPGQFDQRADSCAQCIQLATLCDRPLVQNARVYLLEGDLSEEDVRRIKDYLINPVESREASLELPETLEARYEIPETVAAVGGFTGMSGEELAALIAGNGLAMDLDDALCCQAYFRDTERRDPTITELKLLDTYWSDHCRQPTFSTRIDGVEIDSPFIADAYRRYLELREVVHAGKDKPVTLMDLATIGAKELRRAGILTDLDESEEINACSVKITVDHDGLPEDWLLMFKNETHNHPTEIEPFGGAATCLGGAIRDPLSGRSYVYQAMRLTGAGDPLTPAGQTLPGKLPQRKIVTTAAAGYSSYGNQIGLATGHVAEVYHPGYVAKRMEVGAVIGAAPADAVVREVPAPGDVVILLGGATGRDGCGGATGSSKSLTTESLATCGAEVQKGNAPEERKIQRLFRDPAVTRMIRRCNDFGAGGVSVAIGELADGLDIELDRVPKKYEGLDGTELAISESQERMAVVVAAADVDAFIAAAERENLSATPVATVTGKKRLVMHWNGRVIVDLSREFLSSNGAVKHASVHVTAPERPAAAPEEGSFSERWLRRVGSLNVASQKGLVQRFDSTIGGGTVLLPFGGRYQLSPSQVMAAKLPVLDGRTTTASMMAWGFDPYLSEKSPFHGALYAVVESIAKLTAAGADWRHCWLSFQEYFEKLGRDPARWGKPFAALLGALRAQLELGAGAIGGKDSMSGSFEDLDVPPTLISFAVTTRQLDRILSTDFKAPRHPVYLFDFDRDEDGLPVFDSLRAALDQVRLLIEGGKAAAGWAAGAAGLCEGLTKMALGNRIGFAFDGSVALEEIFAPRHGAILLECVEEVPVGRRIGTTTADFSFTFAGEALSGYEVTGRWEETLHSVYPYHMPTPKEPAPEKIWDRGPVIAARSSFAKPRVLIPVFPGTNCEYDVARVFAAEGAAPEMFVIRNRTSAEIAESADLFAKKIGESQIISIPGGFSGGDEPDGSGKFITAFFRSPAVTAAVMELLQNRDGLMNGICNGFQALIKLGLVPYGEILPASKPEDPTLTFNRIGRHQSTMVRTKVVSNQSPWLSACELGGVYTVGLSHGEGRFVCAPEQFEALLANGQIASQYVDLSGNPSMDVDYNPNGSAYAVEGITSPDGRVFGKMAHFERYSEGIYRNVAGTHYQPIFKGAVQYYK